MYAFNIYLCNYTVKSLCRYVHWGSLVATFNNKYHLLSYKITSVIIMCYVQINLRNGIPINFYVMRCFSQVKKEVSNKSWDQNLSHSSAFSDFNFFPLLWARISVFAFFTIFSGFSENFSISDLRGKHRISGFDFFSFFLFVRRFR